MSDFPDPLDALHDDRTRARDLQDANAQLCWFATVDAEGHPRVRTLVLRSVGERLGVFINATSPKAEQLQTSAGVEVVIWLPSLGRQWRIAAHTETLAPDTLADHWQRRPRTSQVLDHVYASSHPQSTGLSDRASLAQAHERMDARLDSTPDVPPQAQGLLLAPQRIERLQIHNDALHERDAWLLQDGRWTATALVP